VDHTLEWFEGRTSETLDWRQDPGQSFVYATLLSHTGRWDEAQAVLEDVVEATRFPGGANSNAALELAYVLARQGQRDQAFRALGLSPYSQMLSLRAWVEAALGERERAMELLREAGWKLDMHGGFADLGKLEPLRDYPPFVQEFMRTQG
jgi:tetratricopeptide (TPR) repeat protein